MARKEFTYRGKTLEQLKAMSLNEFMELIPSRQRRKFKRGFTDAEKILYENIKHQKKNIKTHCREFIILPEMVGMMIKVYNGKEFLLITIQEEMISHRLGEFSMTRKHVAHNAPGIGATKSSAALSVR